MIHTDESFAIACGMKNTSFKRIAANLAAVALLSLLGHARRLHRHRRAKLHERLSRDSSGPVRNPDMILPSARIPITTYYVGHLWEIIPLVRPEPTASFHQRQRAPAIRTVLHLFKQEAHSRFRKFRNQPRLTFVFTKTAHVNGGRRRRTTSI